MLNMGRKYTHKKNRNFGIKKIKKQNKRKKQKQKNKEINQKEKLSNECPHRYTPKECKKSFQKCEFTSVRVNFTQGEKK